MGHPGTIRVLGMGQPIHPEAWGTRNDRLARDGILDGVAISFLVHLAAIVLLVAASWLLPARVQDLPFCTVSLLDLDCLGGGAPPGEEGAAGGGGGAEAQSPPALPEPEHVPEPQRQAPTVHLEPEVVPQVETPPPEIPVVEKPKPQPKPVTQPPRKPPVARRREKEDSAPSPPREVVGTTESLARVGDSGGLGPGEGPGKGLAGEGPGGGGAAGGGSGQGPFDAAFGSGEGPRFIQRTLPKYPRLARELGKEGTVLLRLTIDEGGRLVSVEVLRPAGSGFDEEAVRAVRESRFSPARRGGKPVVCRANLPIRFVLKDSADN